MLWRVRHFSFWRSVRRFDRMQERSGVIVSNPTLQGFFGGEVVPHVRESSAAGARHVSWEPVVAFVGTAREHKGINELRAAVAELSEDGFTLVVTDQPPTDPQPWEHWIGRTSLAEGSKVVAKADIVAIPSRDGLHSRGQLPAKIMDAAAAGRAIVVADVDPLPWSVDGGSGLVVGPTVEQLTRALRDLRSPGRRQELGLKARDLFEKRYSVDAGTTGFLAAVNSAEDLAGGRRSRKGGQR